MRRRLCGHYFVIDLERVAKRSGRSENCSVQDHGVESVPVSVADHGVDDLAAGVYLEYPIVVESTLGP